MEREREREKNKLHYFSSRAKKDFYLFHNEKERENVIKLFSCFFFALVAFVLPGVTEPARPS